VSDSSERPKTEFALHGGCTMIFDLDTLELKYVISKPLLDMAALKMGIHQIDKARAVEQYRYQQEEGLMHLSEYSLYFGNGIINNFNEPFSFLHH
jgi:hypothetical protein